MWAGTEHQRTHPYGCVFCVRCEGGMHREHRTQRTHHCRCVLHVRCKGEGKGRTEHEKHTHVGVLSVFNVRAEK